MFILGDRSFKVELPFNKCSPKTGLPHSKFAVFNGLTSIYFTISESVFAEN